MFMTFVCCSNDGVETGQKVCLNMKLVVSITEAGVWARSDNPANPTGPRRDVFIATPGTACLNTKHEGNWTVKTNFDELTSALAHIESEYL